MVPFVWVQSFFFFLNRFISYPTLQTTILPCLLRSRPTLQNVLRAIYPAFICSINGELIVYSFETLRIVTKETGANAYQIFPPCEHDHKNGERLKAGLVGGLV